MNNLEHFNLPIEAIQYKIDCPICQCKLSIDPKDIVGPVAYSKNNRLVFELDHASDDMVLVDVMTGDIEISTQKNSRSYQTGTSSNVYLGSMYTNVNSESFTGSCMVHDHYSYTIRMWIDLELRKVADIYLASEFIMCRDASDIVHEVNNYYESQITKYSYYKGSYNYKPFAELNVVELPIVPLNLSNPEETISRIQNLLIFL